MADSRAPRAAARAVTLDDIARRCRVAKSTVSLALRGDARVDPRTGARIRAAADGLGYDPALHESARRLALRKSGGRPVCRVVGFLCQTRGYTLPFYMRLLQGLLEGFADTGFNVVAGTYAKRPTGEAEAATSLQRLLAQGDLDGLAFYADEPTFRAALRAARALPGFERRPAVSLLFPFAGCSAVLADEEDGGLRAARHLLDLGHRHVLRLATLRPAAAEPVSAARWRGAERAFAERGLSPARHLRLLEAPHAWVDPADAPHRLGEVDRAGGVDEAAARLVACLRARPEITAILAQNDSAALRAWRALYRAGTRIPRDVSLVGFDDTDPMTDEGGRALLATVRLPLLEAGRRAADLLARRILGRQREDATIVLPVEFVPRASPAPPRRGRRGRR